MRLSPHFAAYHAPEMAHRSQRRKRLRWPDMKVQSSARGGTRERARDRRLGPPSRKLARRCATSGGGASRASTRPSPPRHLRAREPKGTIRIVAASGKTKCFADRDCGAAAFASSAAGPTAIPEGTLSRPALTNFSSRCAPERCPKWPKASTCEVAERRVAWVPVDQASYRSARPSHLEKTGRSQRPFPPGG